MHRGYIKLWRKILENPVLHERGKRYSRLEAWLWICLAARGTNGDKLQRGQLEVSIRHLAGAWNWPTTVTHRFIHRLEKNSMIMRVERGSERGSEHQAERFTICNYEIYNDVRNTKRNADRNADRNESNKERKESINTTSSDLKNDQKTSNAKSDESFDLWAKEFIEHRQIPYQSRTGDFVRLASLRKSLGLNGRGMPEGWKRSVHNYLLSPLGKYTLADLCSRYDVFIQGPVNEYGKPVESNAQRIDRILAASEAENAEEE